MDTSLATDPLSIAISQYSTLKAFADELGVSYQVVQQWRENGVPAVWCPRIEKAARGVVTRAQLRPDVFN